MSHWMFSCKDVSQRISQSLDITLPLYERVGIWIHLTMCRYCLRFRSQLLLLRKMSGHMHDHPPEEDTNSGLSREAKEKMKAVMRSCT